MKILASFPPSLFVAAVLPFLSLPTPTWAIDPPVRKVTVVGTATIKVVPDEMKWVVQVSINDATLAQAKTRHDASLDAALKFVKTLGGAVQDLQTGGIRFDHQTWFPDNADKTKPFSCSTQFTFTLTDFDKYGSICDELAKIDGLQIQSVDYASSKADATQRDALKQALLNAHDKANDLAVTANCYIDRPLSIEEGTSNDGPRPMPMLMSMARSGSDGTPAAVPGQIDITGTVTATYDMFYK